MRLAGTHPDATGVGGCGSLGEFGALGSRCAGAELRHVVRTRVYLTDIDQWEGAARAHGEFFGQILPVSTFLGIDSLVTRDRLIEIDADAYVVDGE